jgi:hypothetical protein
MSNIGNVKITIEFPDHGKSFGPMEIGVNAEWDEAKVRQAVEQVIGGVGHEIQTRVLYQDKVDPEELMRRIGARGQ